MRIISGSLRGRRIRPPKNTWPTRPTTDFAKEALFNILQNRLDFTEIRMLDLFGGAGNHSLECISRGCPSVTYVDRHPPCGRFVQETAQSWGIDDQIRILTMDVLQYLTLPGEPAFSYVFAGPPYAMTEIDQLPDMIFAAGRVDADGLLVLEHDPTHDFQNHPRFAEVRRYGQTHFAFFT